MEGVRIRPFAQSDHAAVMELWCSAWESAVPGFDLRAEWQTMLDQWAEILGAGSTACVAEREADAALLGFMVLSPDAMELEQIAVAPEEFGTGVAGALMLAAKAQSRETGLLAVVNTFNARAIAFYDKHGFECTDETIHEPSGLPVFHYVWTPSDRPRTARRRRSRR